MEQRKFNFEEQLEIPVLSERDLEIQRIMNSGDIRYKDNRQAAEKFYEANLNHKKSGKASYEYHGRNSN
jgi:hypothetical protein